MAEHFQKPEQRVQKTMIVEEEPTITRMSMSFVSSAGNKVKCECEATQE